MEKGQPLWQPELVQTFLVNKGTICKINMPTCSFLDAFTIAPTHAEIRELASKVVMYQGYANPEVEFEYYSVETQKSLLAHTASEGD